MFLCLRYSNRYRTDDCILYTLSINYEIAVSRYSIGIARHTVPSCTNKEVEEARREMIFVVVISYLVGTSTSLALLILLMFFF